VTKLAKQLQTVQERINQACETFSRPRSEVQLIGASKTNPAAAIRTLCNHGLQHFGENYLNEATTKQAELTDLDIIWHYIGQIQSNKTKQIAQHFHWVHGVDRFKIAKRLSEQSHANKPLNILLQINLDNETSKAGVCPEQTLTLAAQVSELPNLSLRGLMALPKARNCFTEQQACLTQLKVLQSHINQTLEIQMDSISAGMSNDLEAAIAAGSTMVRIGTDLFGART